METRLATVEAHFADIVWKNAPLTTRQLINLCADELNWKRTTTYTVLKRLCDREIFDTKERMVTVRIPKDQFHAMQSEHFVNVTFQGSLPAFIAAFTSRKKLTQTELSEIRKMLNSMEKS